MYGYPLTVQYGKYLYMKGDRRRIIYCHVSLLERVSSVVMGWPTFRPDRNSFSLSDQMWIVTPSHYHRSNTQPGYTAIVSSGNPQKDWKGASCRYFRIGFDQVLPFFGDCYIVIASWNISMSPCCLKSPCFLSQNSCLIPWIPPWFHRSGAGTSPVREGGAGETLEEGLSVVFGTKMSGVSSKNGHRMGGKHWKMI
jgi:hypothetical protein